MNNIDPYVEKIRVIFKKWKKNIHKLGKILRNAEDEGILDEVIIAAKERFGINYSICHLSVLIIKDIGNARRQLIGIVPPSYLERWSYSTCSKALGYFNYQSVMYNHPMIGGNIITMSLSDRRSRISKAGFNNDKIAKQLSKSVKSLRADLVYTEDDKFVMESTSGKVRLTRSLKDIFDLI